MNKFFFWPISQDDILSFRDTITNKLIKFLSVQDPRNDEYRIINVLINYIIIDSLEIFRALRLLEFDETALKNWEVDINSRIFGALRNKNIPEEPLIINELLNGPPKPRQILFPFRYLRSKIYQKNIIRYPLRKIDLEKDIISLSNYDLIDKHAKLVKKRVIFLQPHNFLKNIVKNSFNFNINIVSEIIKILDESLNCFSINFDKNLEDYFKKWLIKCAAIVRYHFKTLHKKKQPKILWTGSGAQIWSRIIRSYFIKKGTYVVGHDHGSGCSHVNDCYKSVRDFEFCNEFISFTEGQIIELNNNLNKHFLMMPGKNFKINSVKRNLQNSHCKFKKIKKEINLCYFGGLYNTERIHLTPLLQKFVFDDFSERLLLKFNQNFNLFWRPYPEKENKRLKDKMMKYKIYPSNLSLKQLLKKADCCVIDSIQGSVILDILKEAKPLLLVNFTSRDLTVVGRKLLEKRASIINGYFSKDNRAEIDWTTINKKIEEAFLLNDNHFYNYYFNYSDI